MITTYIDLIRHGEPVGGKVFRGHTDHPLTERGIAQFKQRTQRLGHRWQHIVSSPLLRCVESAKLLAAEQHIPLQIEPNLSEIHFGEWENQKVAKVMAEHTISHMWHDPMNFCAPQGESTAALQERSLLAWQQALKEHQGQRVLMVTHGGVIRMLAQHLLELTPNAINKLSLPHAAVMSFKVIDTDYQGQPQQWVSLEGMDGSEL